MPPIDRFSAIADTVVAPSANAFPIVPDDENDLPEVTKALYIGTGGTLVLRSIHSDQDATFVNVISGSILDVRTVAVRATGTTASDIVGLA